MAQDKVFFVGQKAFIEKDGKVLVLFSANGKIDFPGGKVQEGESDLRESLLREVKEETGLTVDVDAPFIVWSFDLPEGHANAGRTVFLVGYRCGYRGGEPILSDEHSTFAWIGRDDLEHMEGAGGHARALREYFSK